MKLDPKQMEKMMKQLGMKTESIIADEVVIRHGDSELVIENPTVQKITMGGQDSFQITGDAYERQRGFSDEDVKLVMEQTGASEAEVRSALKKTGDIAAAILELNG